MTEEKPITDRAPDESRDRIPDPNEILNACFTVAGGRAGVEAVRDVGPDVVTLDVGLPDIDGFEVLRRIRQFSCAYVVMLTGREDEVDVLAALQGGADDYITKPFRPREVRARISEMMRVPDRNTRT